VRFNFSSFKLLFHFQCSGFGLTATALLLPHALRLFRILNALFWTSYPLASDVLCLCIVMPSRHAAFRKTLKNHDD
jgi:hypothetical protein